MNGLLANAIEAHGGLERWRQFTGIEVDLVSGGELLDRKGVRSSGTVHFAAKMHEQINSFVATSAPDKQMVFCADRIAVETIEGKLIAERLDPRQSFHGHDLNTPWDPFHRGYFSGYAMWSYLTSPFSLAVEGAQVWDIEPLEKNGELWRGIRAVLPEWVATHSRAQEFYFGDDTHCACMANRHGVTFIVALFRLSHKVIGSSCPTIWGSEKVRLRVTMSIPSNLMSKI